MLPAFEQYLNQLVARAMNAELGRWENFWAPGSYSAVRLTSPGDIVEKCAYALANPVAAGLVRRSDRWPGLWSNPDHVDVVSTTHQRPTQFFRREGPLPQAIPLRTVRPPGFDTTEAFVLPLKRRIKEMEADAEVAMRRTGRTFGGRRAVLRQSPFARPGTLAPRRKLNPRIAGKDTSARVEALRQLRRFADAYRRARDAFWAGERDVVFPPGTYNMRLRFGVACAPT